MEFPKYEDINKMMLELMNKKPSSCNTVMNWYSDYGYSQYIECEKMYNSKKYWRRGGERINKLNGKMGLIACFYILSNFTPFMTRYKSMSELNYIWNGIEDENKNVWIC